MRTKEMNYSYLRKRLYALLTKEYVDTKYRLDNIAYFSGLILKKHSNNRIEIKEANKPETFKNDRIFTFHIGQNIYLLCHIFNSRGIVFIYFYKRAFGEIECLKFHYKGVNRLLYEFEFYSDEEMQKVYYVMLKST